MGLLKYTKIQFFSQLIALGKVSVHFREQTPYLMTVFLQPLGYILFFAVPTVST